jgi:hypothetical protein
MTVAAFPAWVNVAFIAFASGQVQARTTPARPRRGQAHTGTMHTRLNPRAWSLSRQLFALQVVVVAVVVLAAGTAAYLLDRQRSQDSTSDRVLPSPAASRRPRRCARR